MVNAKIMGIFLAVLFLAGGAVAQDYPSKPVTVITPYTEGSATDVMARIVSKKLAEMWGQPVTVENKPGAGGTIGAGVVAKAPPDGYTLMVHSSSHAECVALYNNLPYTLKDFTDIASLASQPLVLFVKQDSEIKSVSHLVATAKAKPGQLKYGSAGIGSTVHFTAEKFKSMAGIDTVHVPFKGGPEAITAIKDSSINYSFLPLAITLKGVKEGKLRALAVTSSKRSAELPEVPTIAESGLAGYEATAWWGIWAPAGIPSGVKDKLVRDVGKALSSTDMLEQFKKSAFEPMSMTPDKFTRFVQSEEKAAAKTIKEAGIKLQ